MRRPVCPACGYRFDVEETAGMITYWGGNPAIETDCPQCDNMLSITETVSRIFKTVVVPDD